MMRKTPVYELYDRMRAWGTDLSFENAVLQGIYQTETVIDADGCPHPCGAVVSMMHANALYQTIMKYQPRTVLEIGMAYGASSLTILTALRALGQGGTLTSIDPFQSSQWKGIGVLNIARSGFSESHTLIEKLDYLALPELLANGKTVDFAYIDGNHDFDYTLLDFFYVDKMLTAGGVVAFNDCALPDVNRVITHVRSRRDYQELDVGLKPNYLTKRHTVRNLVTLTSKQDRYFKKIAGRD